MIIKKIIIQKDLKANLQSITMQILFNNWMVLSRFLYSNLKFNKYLELKLIPSVSEKTFKTFIPIQSS